LVGLAGVVGAAAAGVAVGRSTVQHRRREFRDGDLAELHDRLHARFLQAEARRQALN